MSVNEHDCGNGAFADWPSSFASRLARHHKKIQYGSRNDVILLSKNRVSCPTSLNVAKYLVQTGEPNSSIQKPVILLLGKTGAGKSTFINYLVNIVLGVKVDDPFRFVLVNDDPSKQTRSVTNNVTVYDIPACDPSVLPCGLVLIDTPGFADTQGRERDQQIAEDIEQLLKSGCVPYLHKIVFVASATEYRLTPETVHVIDSVTTIFASDISDHIEVVLTKVDNPDLKYDDALESLSEAGLPVQNTTRLNQSVLYSPDSDFVKCLWNNVNAPSLTQFVDRLTEADLPNFLSKTQKLTEMREVLVAQCESTRNTIFRLVAIEVNLERAQDALKKKQNITGAFESLAQLKNARFDSDVKVKTLNSQKALNCSHCQKTCHKWCRGGLSNCHFLRNPNESCKACGCEASMHVHENFLYKKNYRADLTLVGVSAQTLSRECSSLESTVKRYSDEICENRKLICTNLTEIVATKQHIGKLSMHREAVDYHARSALDELQSIEKEIMRDCQDERFRPLFSTTLQNLTLWLETQQTVPQRLSCSTSRFTSLSRQSSNSERRSSGTNIEVESLDFGILDEIFDG